MRVQNKNYKNEFEVFNKKVYLNIDKFVFCAFQERMGTKRTGTVVPNEDFT